MTKQQTSVEIYRNRSIKLMKMFLYKEITGRQWDMLERKAFEESQKLHEKEIENAVDGFPIHTRHLNGEDYYNETFENHETI